jgi:small-conductance mechanosensitive channel
MENNKWQEVKASLGYDLPLSKDTYSKEKASVFLSFIMGAEHIDREKYREEVRKVSKALVQDAKEILKEDSQEVIKSIEELKNNRSDDVDKLRVELAEQYEGKLKKAKEVILKLKGENEELKRIVNDLHKEN